MSFIKDDKESLDVTSRIKSSWMAKNKGFALPLSQERLDALAQHWKAATSCFSNQQAVQQWWDRIKELHSQDERAYHTLVHLEELFGFLNVLGVDSSNEQVYTVLALTIFFHDAIYNAKSGTNEEDSAKLFQDFCQQAGGDYPQKDCVVDYILATKKHKAPENGDTCLAMFLDMDMAVLGKGSSAYQVYAGLVRREYSFVERSVYCEKRAEVLKTFLKEKSIFCTPAIKNALEQRARENLQMEIDMLESGIIPGEP